MDRQPSSYIHSPRLSTISGLTIVTGPSPTSYTNNCFCTPIWLAARPVPGAAYITSTISSARRTSDPSMSATGAALVLRTGSPNTRISWAITGSGYRPCQPGFMAGEQYFAERPVSRSARREVRLDLADGSLRLATAAGGFPAGGPAGWAH